MSQNTVTFFLAHHCDGVQTLHAQGLQIVPPHNTRGLHPYAIALAEGDAHVWSDPLEGVLCVLRWPQPSKCPTMEMPLVAMRRGGLGMRLVARSAREYVARALLEEELAKSASDANA